MTNSNHPAYQRILARAQRLNPGKQISMALIDDVDPALLDAYISGDRVRVETTYPGGETWTRTGTVGCSMGWGPTLLLIKTSRSNAGDSIGRDEVVTAVKRRGENYYLPTFTRHVGRTGATATALFGAKAGA